MTDKTEANIHEIFESYNKNAKSPIDPKNIMVLTDRILLAVENESYIKKVREFHLTFDQFIGDKPQVPLKEVIELRLNLLTEEIMELQQACLKGNKIEALDAFLDIQYVLSGAIIAFGMDKIFDEAFDEVHRSNMSKACLNSDEVDKTKAKYMTDSGTITYVKEKENKFLVFRHSDKKLLKSINYQPAQLTKFLE